MPLDLEQIRNQIVVADVRDFCREIPPETVHAIITSPPYFRQRVYEGVEPSVWGGAGICDHEWEQIRVRDSNLGGGRGARSKKQAQNPGSYQTDPNRRYLSSELCRHCGAWRGTLGNEPTAEQYVANLLEVARGWWRVLRDDGNLLIVLDGKYNGSGGAGGDYNLGGSRAGQPRYPRTAVPRYKHKDWIPIPWLVGIAFQRAGWYLRLDIIWQKNRLCESAKDRFSRGHEYILHLTKRPRNYWNYEAGCVPAKHTGDGRGARTDNRRGKPGINAMHGKTPALRNRRSVIYFPNQPSGVPHYATYPPRLIDLLVQVSTPPGGIVFDPFMGVGTTAISALRQGRSFVGCEISSTYVELARQRLEKSGFDVTNRRETVTFPTEEKRL